MRFSIIVPVYNVEEYLKKCVDSILCQDFDSFEVILVDDGSQDHSPQICDSYAQKDSKVIVVHKKNGGAADARNVGIGLARGEYLLFVDSDDYWNQNGVLKKIDEKLSMQTVDIVQFGREKYYSAEEKLVKGKPRDLAKYDGLESSVLLGELVSNGALSISACFSAFSREFITGNDLYFHEGVKAEDLEWAIRLYLHDPKWAFINESFYVYRAKREGSVTATIDYKHMCDYCWILEQSVARTETAVKQIKEPLMSYLMYHVLIASALVYRVNLQGRQYREIMGRLKTLCQGRIDRYKMDKKVKLASSIYCVCGFTMMTKVLGFYLNKRGR